MSADDAPHADHRARLFELTLGYYATNAVYAAARLGIPDELGTGTLDHRELAERLDADPDPLLRLLRLLTAFEVVTEPDPGSFALSEIGAGLRSAAEDSLRDVVLQFASPWQQRSWSELEYSVRTGRCSFEKLTGTDVFRFLAANPEHAAVFDRSMMFFAAGVTSGVVEAYDFSRFGTIADIGGGHGALINGITAAFPDTRGILFDLPHVIDQAREHLAGVAARDRIELVAGDFFTSAVPKADAYVLKSIIHDWSDEDAATVLANCRAVMERSDTLLLVEMPRPETAEPAIESRLATGSDINMLVHTGGRERTETEFRDLLCDNGFTMTGCYPVRSRWGDLRLSSVLEARPADRRPHGSPKVVGTEARQATDSVNR